MLRSITNSKKLQGVFDSLKVMFIYQRSIIQTIKCVWHHHPISTPPPIASRACRPRSACREPWQAFLMELFKTSTRPSAFWNAPIQEEDKSKGPARMKHKIPEHHGSRLQQKQGRFGSLRFWQSKSVSLLQLWQNTKTTISWISENLAVKSQI